MSLPYNYLREVIADNVWEVDSLVNLLEITIEDILDRFPDKVYEHSHKFVEDEDDEAPEQLTLFEEENWESGEPEESEEDVEEFDE